jgi:hypothetical protein
VKGTQCVALSFLFVILGLCVEFYFDTFYIPCGSKRFFSSPKMSRVGLDPTESPTQLALRVLSPGVKRPER